MMDRHLDPDNEHDILGYANKFRIMGIFSGSPTGMETKQKPFEGPSSLDQTQTGLKAQTFCTRNAKPISMCSWTTIHREQIISTLDVS